jgi:hypothetical protein
MAPVTTSTGSAIADTLAAYTKAARTLLEGRYQAFRDSAPLHVREPCSIFILECVDGIFVRYDLSTKEEAKVRFTNTMQRLAEIAPTYSDQLLHFPDDPASYQTPQGAPEIALTRVDPTGATEEIMRLRPVIYGTTTLREGFQMQPPPARPAPLIAIQNEFDLQVGGRIIPTGASPEMTGPDVEQFIAHGRFRLKLAWQTIEVYPPLAEDYWKPEYAPMWAELDLLAAVAQKNLLASTLAALDSRGAARKQYAALLQEMESLLAGPEEPVDQFLKQHPELLCPTSDRRWFKLAFGDTVSDFVFREPTNDYLLVEIEAPVRELFRRDGQQRQELTHAINQITDWIQFICDNKEAVENDLGLVGISTAPRSLVVMGRSASLTDENRRKLVTLQAQHAKLRIMTYDDVLAAARANLERLFGPLDLIAQNAELYYFK